MLAPKVADAVRFAADKMVKANLYESAHLFADVYCLEPGQSQRPHSHVGADKLYYVLSGRGLFTVGAERAEHGPGTLVPCPAGLDHGVENPGPDRLTLLVVMAPNPNRKE
jgi:mannose-6-phosphate isomerase-like protein (cupin superfamily)